MKRKLLIILLLYTINIKAQEQKNNLDARFLHQTVQKLPSYKDQVKENAKLRFNLERDFTFKGGETDFEVFIRLCELIAPIRDNHLALYTKRDSAFEKPPLMEIDRRVIDSALRVKAADSVCGIYYANPYQLQIVKIGLNFVAVIEANGKYYTQFLLREITPDHFDMIGFGKGGTGYFLNRNILYSNGRLTGTVYKKYQKEDYLNVSKDEAKYAFRMLDNIAYLRLGSFSTSNANLAESAKFFNGIQVPENTKHLIVDVRNNGGGGYKNSKKFLDLIKRFNGRVHLIINSNTVSNAEQFTIDLMALDKVTTYGETTRGTICYGNNMGTVVELPSKRFSFYITDMLARSKDLPYESYGIKPQVKLDPFSKDWVAQVVDLIKFN